MMHKYFAIAVAMCVALTHRDGRAQEEPESADIATEAEQAGLERYEQEDWAEAYERFAEAERAAHSPARVLQMARCKSKLDELLAARTLLRGLLAEPSDDSDEQRRVRKQARKELARIERWIPSLFVELGPSGAGAKVLLDQTPVEREALTRPIEVDPGPHELWLEPRHGEPFGTRVVVKRGARGRRVALFRTEPAPVVAEEPRAAGFGEAPDLVYDAAEQKRKRAEDVVAYVGGGLLIGGGSCAIVGVPSVIAGAGSEFDNPALEMGVAMLIIGGAAATVGTIVLVAEPGVEDEGDKTVIARASASGVELLGSF